MLKLLLILFISLLFQACQVKEEVTGAKQVATNYFPGATLQTVLAGNGWKKLGDDIDVSLRFPLPITVTNSPYIDAQIGSSIRRFYYESGTGTKNLIFRYTVTSADLDTGSITFDDNIELNGGTLTYSPSDSVIENVPTGLDIPPSEIKVDGIVPYATQTTAPTGGNYATGQQLKYRLLYSEKVFVTGAPTFSIYLSSSTVTSKYKSGSGTANLEFSRLLTAADSDTDGFTSGTLLNLSLISGITITDEAGNSVPSTIYTTTSTNILVNVVQPLITSVTPPAAATYTVGQTLDFTVLMSEAVDVTGTPAITIALNTGTVLATYLSGTGTNTLIYRYTVLANHVDIDGITLRSPMNLRGGTIKNLAATHNAAMIYTVPLTPTVLVDASTGPFVVTAFKPSNATYLESVNLDFTLNFNGVVNVTGTPRLPLIIGNTTVYANYHLGGGTSSLIFRYTTTTSDLDLDGISLSGPVDLNSGSIKDAGNRAAILSYVTPDTTGILIDGTSPAIILASAGGPSNLITGQYLYFSIKFDKIVTVVAPNPTLTLTVGLNPQSAIYISGSGTDTLNFRYTAQVGDDDTDGVVITSPLVTTGTIKDASGHNANLTFANVTSGYNVDGVSSTISSFVVPAAGTYKMGDTLDFVVNWSEPTFISGSPRLVLTVGTSTYYATYVPALSSTTSFTYRYTVLAGHLDDIDGIVTSGLQLNGGQLKDASGNNSNYSFIIPSLAAYLIDGVVPYVASLSVPANGIYRSGSNLVFTIVWDQAVTVTGAPVLNLIIGSTAVTAAYTSVNATTATFTYTVVSGLLDTNGISLLSAMSLLGGATIKDLAGNDSYLQLNPPDLSGVTVDSIVPTIIAVVAPTDGIYKIGDNIDFKVLWSEPITFNTALGTPSITLTLDSGVVAATYYAAGSTSTISVFRYTVLSTNTDVNGVTLTSPVNLNLGTIRDTAFNDATLSFSAPPLTGVLVDGLKATILSWTAPANGTYGIGDNIDVIVTWSEPVDVDTSGGTPCLTIYTDTSHSACYVPGPISANITFRYTVSERLPVASGQYNQPTWVYGLVSLNSGTIQDGALNNVYLTFPVIPYTAYYPWTYYPNIIVDDIRPTVSSITSANITVPSKPNYFKSSHTIEYNVTFSESVNIVGTPRLTLNIGGATRYAVFDLAATNAGGSPTTSKRFRCILDAGDVLLDLDGIDVSTTFSNGSIEDVSGNPLTATFATSEKDFVYYDATLSRYNVYGSDYSTSTLLCPGSGNCVTGVTDITGNGYNLTASAPGPKVIASGFGSQNTPYMQFDGISSLKMPNWIYPTYVIFVMKTVPDASITGTSSYHTLMSRHTVWNSTDTYSSSNYSPAVRFASTSSIKTVLMNPSQKMKINDGAFPGTYTSSLASAGLWTANTTYIFSFQLSAATIFTYNTIFGGPTFKGQIAEIIFLSGSPALTEAKVDVIVDQLNTIHGAYD